MTDPIDDYVKERLATTPDWPLEALREIAVLRDALEWLVDEQNGPPLERDRETWAAAMFHAAMVLGRSE